MLTFLVITITRTLEQFPKLSKYVIMVIDRIYCGTVSLEK